MVSAFFPPKKKKFWEELIYLLSPTEVIYLKSLNLI
jgi:hypothetical protein